MNFPKMIDAPTSYWLSFELLYKDLQKTFSYVEPVENNFLVYSLRYYELLLRACTEFESLCKDLIIKEKLSPKNYEDFNIKDYYLLASHFQNVKFVNIEIGYFLDPVIIIKPLEGWQSGHKLDWYSEYNIVKHNRNNSFALANLKNVLNSVAGVFALLNASGFSSKADYPFLKSGKDFFQTMKGENWPMFIKTR